MLLSEPLFILKSILGTIHFEMVRQSEALLLILIFLRLLLLWLHEGVAIRMITSRIFFLTNSTDLRRGLEGRVEDGSDLGDHRGETGPSMRIFFGEKDLPPEDYLEGSNMGEDDILVGIGVDVLVLSDFEGDEVGGDHIADNLELGDAMGQHFSD